VEGNRHDLIRGAIPPFAYSVKVKLPGGAEENHENLQSGQYTSRDSNRERSEYRLGQLAQSDTFLTSEVD
jgi:hypothetical protein